MTTFMMLLLLFVYSASAEKHTLEAHHMLSFGIPNVPEYTLTTSVDEVAYAYYDSSTETSKLLQEWFKEIIRHDLLFWKTEELKMIHNYQNFKAVVQSFKQLSNQTEGVHVVQQIVSCEWDDETGKVDGFVKVADTGENFLFLDIKTETWITLKPDAEFVKQELNKNEVEIKFWKNGLTSECIQSLKKLFNPAKISLQRRDVPSVSLLQKTPSSPVTCHATGFYPDKAAMFWRKDGEEVHEGVELGELLPNPDGTFQMSLELNISSVRTEDWSRYDCVFQLSGVESDIVTKLDTTRIKTNEETSSKVIIAVLVVLVVVVVAAVGVILYKKKKDQRPAPRPENIPELSERLEPEPEARSTNTP